MSRQGHGLKQSKNGDFMVCPEAGLRYQETHPGVMECVDLNEGSPLPQALSVGGKTYEELKSTDYGQRTTDHAPNDQSV